MRFEDIDKRLRVFETAHDQYVMPQIHIVVRLDGRGFTKKTKELWQLEAPFDKRFNTAMVKTTEHLMNCGFNIMYGYTQSDEISLIFSIDDYTFKRKIRKINSVLAGEASSFFSLQMQSLACFDCRVSQLPNCESVQEYFRWRQEDAHRNSLNAHCYWLLRRLGNNYHQATALLSGKGMAEKHELLLSNDINFNDLPNWQKRGVGLYWGQVAKQGFNPQTQEQVTTYRRQIIVDEHLPIGSKYSDYINNITTV